MITYKQALSTLEELVAIRGEDYVYESPTTTTCLYADPETGSYSCGVGYVFMRLAPEAFEELKLLEKLTTLSMGVTQVFYGYNTKYWVDADRKAQELLSSFQRAQDSDVPYGAALKDAVKWAAYYEEVDK